MHNAEAAACYSTCIALRPDFAWTWYNRGLAYYKLNEQKKAVADLDRALALKPDLADAYLFRALAREGLHDYGGAVRDYTRALDHGSSVTQVYFLRAVAREKAGDHEGAKGDREEGFRRTPEDEGSWIARGMARLPQDPKGALADIETAVKLNPRSLAALQSKAHVLADWLHRDRDVVTTLDRAVALYPENVLPRAGRGVSLARLGELDRALADAQEALLLDTKPPNLYQVACIYALTSRKQPADRLQAFELLSRALRGGFGLDYVDTDSDLDPIREQPEFKGLVKAARALQPAQAQPNQP
jgi:tetratricopeptide (TPR) repeat protein